MKAQFQEPFPGITFSYFSDLLTPQKWCDMQKVRYTIGKGGDCWADWIFRVEATSFLILFVFLISSFAATSPRLMQYQRLAQSLPGKVISSPQYAGEHHCLHHLHVLSPHVFFLISVRSETESSVCQTKGDHRSKALRGEMRPETRRIHPMSTE